VKALLAGFLAAGFAAATAHAQSSTWQVPRTPDGRPDLQGVWSNNSVTPMTRPPQWRDKERLTDAEVEELKQLVARYTDQGGDAIFGSLVQMALTAKEKGEFNQTSYDRTTGNYNQFWMADRDWDNRTSLITDPKNGQLPALTAEAVARRASRARPVVVEGSESGPRGRADGPEDRPLSERCITYGAPRTGTGYNSYVQLIQSPETVVILQEMIHDARVVPMTNLPHLPAARRSTRPLGRRHAGGRVDELHRRFPGFDARRQADRALHARQPGLHQLGNHRRRSGHLGAAVDDDDPPEADGRSGVRVRVPRRQSLDDRHPRGRARRGSQGQRRSFEDRFAVGRTSVGRTSVGRTSQVRLGGCRA
jgi:hypothetical protein